MKKIDKSNSKVLADYYSVLTKKYNNKKIVEMLAKEQNIDISKAVEVFVDFRHPDSVGEDRELMIACLEYQIDGKGERLDKLVADNIAKHGYLQGHIKVAIDGAHNAMYL